MMTSTLISSWGLLAEIGYGWDIGLSIAVFVSIALMIISLFGQGEEVKLSPQREIALATGHSDRETLFENVYMRQIMWALLSISHRMALPKPKAWISRTLVAAGSPNFYTCEEYMALSILTGLVLAFFLELFYALVFGGEISLVVVAFGVLAGIGMMMYQLYNHASKRMRTIARRLPYALDLISLAMGAGATFTESIKTIVREEGENPLNSELRAVLAEIELGTTRRKALQNLAQRVPLEGMQTTVASVVQAEELGTALHAVLHDQATLLRLQRSVHAENAAAVASVRILLPCLLIVIAVIFTIFGPAIVRGLNGGLF